MSTLRHILTLLLLIALQGHLAASEPIKENCPPSRGTRGVQCNGTERRGSISIADTTKFVFIDSLYNLTNKEIQQLSQPLQSIVGDSASSLTRCQLRQQRLASFTPDPGRATWSALVFPGGGQIYNHKYWKLPIVYGGFLGCAYALNWNNQMYSDYSQAYLDIMDDDPGTASYEDMLPPRYNVEANKDYLTRVFKNRKDNYRRQRDLSIFCFIGVYLLSVVDAYVDAELSNFDITDDLSVQVRPTTIENRQTTLHNQAYGLQCSFSF